MKFSPMFFAAIAFALSAPVLAADKPQDKSNDKKQSAPKERKICRTETVTGSLATKRRTCLTQDQWDDLAASTMKGMVDHNNGASTAPQRSYNPGE